MAELTQKDLFNILNTATVTFGTGDLGAKRRRSVNIERTIESISNLPGEHSGSEHSVCITTNYGNVTLKFQLDLHGELKIRIPRGSRVPHEKIEEFYRALDQKGYDLKPKEEAKQY